MTVSLAAASVRNPKGVGDIFLAGVAGGGLDFIVGSLLAYFNGRPIERMWKAVAAGWLGPDAFKDGQFSFLLGVATHFGIAIVMAAAFALSATRAPVLYRRPWTAGVIYGLVLYVVMSFVVIPLRFQRVPPLWTGPQTLIGIGVHIGVGLAIVLVLAWRRGAIFQPVNHLANSR
jgi:hypothetical protein